MSDGFIYSRVWNSNIWYCFWLWFSFFLKVYDLLDVV